MAIKHAAQAPISGVAVRLQIFGLRLDSFGPEGTSLLIVIAIFALAANLSGCVTTAMFLHQQHLAKQVELAKNAHGWEVGEGTKRCATADCEAE